MYRINKVMRRYYIMQTELIISHYFSNYFLLLLQKSDSDKANQSMKNNIEMIDDFKVLSLAGDGGQANVYLCTKNFKLYAIKVFNANMYKGEAFKRETKFLSLLQKHPNLIQMCEANPEAVIKYGDSTELKRSIIVLEFAEKGDLFEYIKVTKGFQPEMARTLFLSILDGIQHLHSIGVAHRDMKPQNILFNHDFQVKLSDFGLSTFCQGNQRNFILKTRVGTQGFKAPEVDSGEYNGEKADIFAIGVILFLLFAGSPPFMSTSSQNKIYKIIIQKNFDKFWSIHEKNRPKNFFPSSFKSLINSLLCSNPDERPSITQIRDSQWLKMPVASPEQMKQELSQRFLKILNEFENREKLTSIIKKHHQKEEIKVKEVKELENKKPEIVKNPEDLIKEEKLIVEKSITQASQLESLIQAVTNI